MSDLGVVPDTYLKLAESPVAQVPTPEVESRNVEKRIQTQLAREATLPSVGYDGRGGAIVYAAAKEGSILMPDLGGRSVRDAARTCALLGLRLEAKGEGRATSQSPAPGSELISGQVVYVNFARAQ